MASACTAICWPKSWPSCLHLRKEMEKLAMSSSCHNGGDGKDGQVDLGLPLDGHVTIEAVPECLAVTTRRGTVLWGKPTTSTLLHRDRLANRALRVRHVRRPGRGAGRGAGGVRASVATMVDPHQLRRSRELGAQGRLAPGGEPLAERASLAGGPIAVGPAAGHAGTHSRPSCRARGAAPVTRGAAPRRRPALPVRAAGSRDRG